MIRGLRTRLLLSLAPSPALCWVSFFGTGDITAEVFEADGSGDTLGTSSVLLAVLSSFFSEGADEGRGDGGSVGACFVGADGSRPGFTPPIDFISAVKRASAPVLPIKNMLVSMRSKFLDNWQCLMRCANRPVVLVCMSDFLGLLILMI